MSELNSYLMAKLLPRNNSPSKEKTSIASEFVREMGLDSFNTVKQHVVDEEDYSAGSTFWKNAIEKNQTTEEKVTVKPKAYVSTERRDGIPKSTSSNSVATLLKKLKNDTNSCETIEVVEQTIENVVTTEPPQLLDQLKTRICRLGVLVDKEIKEMEGIVGKNDGAVLGDEPLIEAFADFKTSIQQKVDKLIQENEKMELEYQKFQSVVMGKLEEIKIEKDNNIPSHSNISHSSLNHADVQKLVEEIKAVLPTGSIQALDRPTKNIIVGVNDKIIQLAKLQEHSFNSLNLKLGQFDKRQTDSEAKSLLVNIETRLDKIEKRARDTELYIQRILDYVGKRNSESDSDDDGTDGKLEVLRTEMKTIKKLIETENQITHDRMSQFLNMFQVLQDVIFSKGEEKGVGEMRKIIDEQNQKISRLEKLLSGLVRENDRTLSLVGNINTTLTKYLPLNLETKLHRIEALLSD